jgi:tetratricopeptide (TPR) repeat protein
MTDRGHSPSLLVPPWIARVGGIMVACACMLPCLGESRTASAQPAGQTGAAEALFREAVALAKDGEYRKAIDKFQASYELDPARGTLLGWALAEARSGRVAAALAHYQQLRDAAKRAGDERREKAAEQGIADLTPRVPTLVIRTEAELPEGTEIEINGRSLPSGVVDSRLPMEPGEYVLVAKAPNGAESTQRVSLPEGARETVLIALGKATKPTPPPPTPPPRDTRGGRGITALQTTGIVLSALGVAGLGVGAYYWIESGETYSEVSAACPDQTCPPTERGAVDNGIQQENIGRVGLIVGGLALATGVTLVLVGSRSKSTEPRRLALTLSPRSMSLSGRF